MRIAPGVVVGPVKENTSLRRGTMSTSGLALALRRGTTSTSGLALAFAL